MKKSLVAIVSATALALTACSGTEPAKEGEKATVGPFTAYCAMQEEDCSTYLAAFTEETGIKANFVRLGAGEILARVDAEKANPQAALWLGGAADNQTNAGGKGLREEYAPKGIDEIDAKWKDPKNLWTPLSWAPQLIVQNPAVAAAEGISEPTSWEDLTDPSYKGLIALADPAASGTAFVFVASLLQLFGEDEGFDLLKRIDANVVQYTSSGAAPVTMTGQGEIAAAVTYLHDVEAAIAKGFKVEGFFPEEGVGFEISATALIANAPKDQVEGAKAFMDWTLTESGQQHMAGTYRLAVRDGIVNPNAKIDVSNVKTIDYDLVWAGENRDRILARYQEEIRRGAEG